MKRLVAFATLMLAGLLFLAACTTPPVTIGLSDVAIDLSVAVDSAGKVIFPENPLEFKNPVPATSIASVTVRGKARLAQAASVSFDVYATDTNPDTLGCTRVGSVITGYFYVCDPATTGVAKVSQNTIAFDNEEGPVPFTLSGDMLASGINNQNLYLGAVISGGAAGNTLYLEEMSATVQLNVGK